MNQLPSPTTDPAAPRTRRGARTRAFTLLELVVTVALSATLFALVLPWVLNLLVVSSANLDASTTARAAATITRAVDKDLAAAVTCPATGSAIHAGDATHFALFTTTGADGQAAGGPQLVVWALRSGHLLRTAVPAQLSDVSCGPLDPSQAPLTDPASVTWATFATGVTASPGGGGSLRLFSGVAPTVPRLVTLDLRIGASDSTSAPTPVTGSYTLPLTYTGLT